MSSAREAQALSLVTVTAQDDTEAGHTPDSPAAHWSLGTRIIFRFGFIYWLLYSMPIPGIYRYRFVDRDGLAVVWHNVVPWFAKHFLNQDLTVAGFQGAGDSAFNFARVLLFVVLAAAGTAVWSLAARKSSAHPKLHAWLRLYLRLGLGAAMFTYGVAKLLTGQFAATPSFAELLRTYGDSSPQGLLWTFMAASRSYVLFTGLAEMLGGALLFVPRLATLGALICAAGLANVLMLNMSYDVPVKLYSFHLLLKAVFLVAPDVPRLAALLVFNRQVDPARPQPLFATKALNRGIVVFQILFGVWAFGGAYADALASVNYRAAGPSTPFYGVWFVDEFSFDGQIRQPVITDESTWARIVIEFPDQIAIQTANGRLRRFTARRDQGPSVADLQDIDNAKSKAKLTFSSSEADRLTVDGEIDGHRIRAALHREQRTFLLTTRGFHWVNRGFNR
jgi:uncharacterized membrane protein YphA (DoxX/SURF4 family)